MGVLFNFVILCGIFKFYASTQANYKVSVIEKCATHVKDAMFKRITEKRKKIILL